MKRNIIPAALAATLILGMGAVSCKSDKSAAASQEDSLQAVEEMVAAVEETPSDAKSYDATFFGNSENKSDVATDSTYAVTPTGLKYVVVTEGTGKSPSATDQVTVHYTGTLLDGTVFDSSVSRGEPIAFPLNGVIKGWTEGLQLMKEGGTTVFYIPSELAYGETGTPGGPIPPNSDLIFEVQLIQVN